MKPAFVVVALWIGFVLSWIAAMPWSSPVTKRLGLGREVRYRVILILGTVVFAVPARNYRGALRLWYLPYDAVWPTIALIAVGFAFA